MPLISLHPQKPSGVWIRWADVAAGRQDADLRLWATAFRAWNRRAFFVYSHEPENDPDAGTAAEFRAAYDHIRQIFDSVGTPKLRWTATFMRGTYAGAHGGIAQWVPKGCQLLGVDGYNRGECSGAGWVSFDWLFRPARDYAATLGKHLIIQEWGTVRRFACGATGPESAASWIRNAGQTIKSWPEVKAVIYTNAAVQYAGRKITFRVDNVPAALRAYSEVGAEPYFS